MMAAVGPTIGRGMRDVTNHCEIMSHSPFQECDDRFEDDIPTIALQQTRNFSKSIAIFSRSDETPPLQ
jgi:hypothetical protein